MAKRSKRRVALLLIVLLGLVAACEGNPGGPPSASVLILPTSPAQQPISAASPAPLLLSETAAAVATALPTVTPIATPDPTADRPTAAVRVAALSVGIDAPVVEVGWHVQEVGGERRGVWDTVAGAAAHLRGSADPGQAGNCVLAGHASTEGGAVFRRLGELAVGSPVTVTTANGQSYQYTVTEVLTLEEVGATAEEKREHARWLDPTAEPVLTLVTCWPDWSYTHRLVVRARLGP